MATIGFSNLDEQNPFTVAVRQALEAEAARFPDLTLLVRDNDLNTEKAKAHALEFAEIPVDLAIIFHIDERAGMEITAPLRIKRIPIVCIDIPIPLTIFFGIDSLKAGRVAGESLTEWISQEWSGQVDKVLVMTEYRTLEIFHQRFDAALDVLRTQIGINDDHMLHMDNGGSAEVTRQRVQNALRNWSGVERIAIICQNDKIAAGVLEGARDLGREQHVAVLSYDGTDLAIAEFEKPDSRLIVSPSFQPQRYGQQLIELARRILNGERVPARNYVDPLNLTRWNYREHLMR